jgi:hypothetical protein
VMRCIRAFSRKHVEGLKNWTARISWRAGSLFRKW